MRCIMLRHCETQGSHAICCSLKTTVFNAGNGKELPGAGLSDKAGQPQKFVATGWFELHQLLRKHLQPNTIQLGKRFTSLADKGVSYEYLLLILLSFLETYRSKALSGLFHW